MPFFSLPTFGAGTASNMSAPPKLGGGSDSPEWYYPTSTLAIASAITSWPRIGIKNYKSPNTPRHLGTEVLEVEFMFTSNLSAMPYWLTSRSLDISTPYHPASSLARL